MEFAQILPLAITRELLVIDDFKKHCFIHIQGIKINIKVFND